jgi:capsular polysaccharide biosynthesis protein
VASLAAVCDDTPRVAGRGQRAEFVQRHGDGQRLRVGQGTYEVLGSVDVGYALRVLLPRTWILIASGAIAGAAAFFASGLLPPTFESHATLIVGQSSGAPPIVYEDLLAAQILATTYAELSTTTPVLTDALERAGSSISVDELRDHVRVEAIRNSPLVVVTAEFQTAGEAARVANAIAEGTAAIGADDGNSLQISVVDPAQPADEPISPHPVMNAAVAGAIGVLASAALVLLIFGTSRRPSTQGATSDGAKRRSAFGEGR